MSSSTSDSNFVRTNNVILTNNSNFFTTITSSPSMSTNLQVILPPNSGASNTFLNNDGSGTTSWSSLPSQTGATGVTGSTGLGTTGSTGPTGILGADPAKNFFIYAANVATTASIPTNGLIPLTQYAPTGSGILWSTDTATVTQNGTYKIIYFAYPLSATTIGISINGAAPQALNSMGLSTNLEQHSNCLIVRLNANDTVAIMNVGPATSFYSYENTLTVSVYLTMYRIEF